jgi:beta-1,4-mannosyltransferase
MALKVLMWPYRRAGSNDYTRRLGRALQDLGVDVREFPGRVRAARGDVVHVHWPEAFLNSSGIFRATVQAAAQLAVIAALKRRGLKLVYTAHNAVAHDRRHTRLERLYMSSFDRMVDLWISPSVEGARLVSQRRPHLRRNPSTVVPLGIPGPRGSTSPPPANGSILFFGSIRPYKNVPGLIQAYAESTTARPLVIRGAAQPVALTEEISDLAASVQGVDAILKSVSDDDLLAVLNDACLVVLPFLEVLNSSSLLTALNNARPTLVPRTPVFEGIQAEVGAEWIYLYEGPLTGSILTDAIRWAEGSRDGIPPLSRFSWESVAAATLEAYRRCLSPSDRCA